MSGRPRERRGGRVGRVASGAGEGVLEGEAIYCLASDVFEIGSKCVR